MFEYPTWDSFQYIIELDIGYAILKFKQASANETMEYFHLLDEKHIIKISNYRDKIIDNAEIISKKRFFKFYYKRKIRNYLKNHFFDYHNEIIQSMHKVWKSKYHDEDTPKQKWERKQLFQTSQEIISKMTNIPVNEVYEKLTMEQVWRWLDKARFDYYETFEWWQAINTNVKSKMWLSQEQKALLDYIKANKNNGNNN